MRRTRLRRKKEEHVTARPIDDLEREPHYQFEHDAARKRVPRPDGDCFSYPVDTETDPPIASLFDSYDQDEDA